MKGALNEKSKLAHKETVPITMEILEEIRKNLFAKAWKSLSKLTIWAACTLAYWGVFRLGELLPARGNVFDKETDLLWEDIEFQAEGITVTIKSPKVVGRGVERVFLQKLSEKWVCPVRAMKVLARKTGWEDKLHQPVFLLNSGYSLTRKVFLDSVNKLLKNSPFDSLKIQGKSFRSGIPSEVELLPKGFREKHVKVLGRWAGVSCRTYMKFDEQEKTNVFGKVSRKLIKAFLCRKGQKGKGTQTNQKASHQQQFRGRN
jgi:hypothetical protein